MDDWMDVDDDDVEDKEDCKAPTTYTCWVCREELTEEGPPSIQCCSEQCDQWACMTCVDISSDATNQEFKSVVIYCDDHDEDVVRRGCLDPVRLLSPPRMCGSDHEDVVS